MSELLYRPVVLGFVSLASSGRAGWPEMIQMPKPTPHCRIQVGTAGETGEGDVGRSGWGSLRWLLAASATAEEIKLGG